MTYRTSIEYTYCNPGGEIPRGYDMRFEKDRQTVGKRVTLPNYHQQIPGGRVKLLASSVIRNPYRCDQELSRDVYEITKKTYESMEEKPELVQIETPDGKKAMGWIEEDNQDKYAEHRYYIVKGIKI